MSSDAPADVTIEAADTDDADAMADMWVDLAADQRQYGSRLRTDANRAAIHEAMLRHAVTDTAFVARRGGERIGFVTFGASAGRYEQDTVHGTVHNVYVREGDRGMGVGGALLDTAEAALRSMGVETVTLEAMAENDAARSFYSRHGYTPHRLELEKPMNDGSVSDDEG